MRIKYLSSLGVVFILLVGCAAHAADDAPETDGRNFVAAPIVSSDPAFGNALGVMSMYFYRSSAHDTISPKSVVGALGMYSDNDSYVVSLFNRMYLLEDRYRTGLVLNGIRINNEFDDPAGGRAKFSNDVGFLYGRLLRLLANHTYLGLHGIYLTSTYSPSDAPSADYLESVGAEDTDNGGLGIVLNYDSRDDQRYPTVGTFVEARTMSMLEALGSTDPYDTFNLDGSHYREVAPRNILALRATGQFASDDVPYSGKARLGGRRNIRGYVAGEQVAANLISGTVEYRWQSSGRFGAVAFAEVAALYDGGIDNVSSDTIYASGGLGIRYMLSTENRMNFRIDYAVGEGDNDGLYVGLGEAF